MNPATGTAFARAPLLSRVELDRAVASARRAFSTWRTTPVADRRAAIGRMARILTENAPALAELLTLEQGKPVGQSRDEISRAATQSVGMADIVIADELIENNAQRRIELKYFPLGRRRHHHTLECPHQPGRGTPGRGALHRQHRGAQALALHAAVYPEDRGAVA